MRSASLLTPDDLRQRVDELEFVYALSTAVARADTLAEVYDEALDGVLAALGADRVALLLFDGGGVMRFVAWRGLSAEYRAAVEGHSPWSVDEVDPQPVVVPDVGEDESLADYRPVIEAEGIRSLAFIPLVERGRLIGKFMAYWDERRQVSSRELRLTSTVANHVAFAIERQRAAAMLRLGEARFRQAVEAAGAMVYDALPRRGVLQATFGMPRLLGLPNDAVEAPHSRWLDRVHPEDRAGCVDAMNAGLASGRRFLHEYRVRHADGAWIDVEDHAMVLEDPDGPRIVGVVLDVTERKRSQDEMRRARDAAERASRSKTDFVASISHELRTPLNSIIGYLDLLRLGIPEEVPERVGDYVSKIRLSSNHLLQLIEEILTFSRLESGREHVRVAQVDVRELVSEVRAIMEPLATSAGLEFSVLDDAAPAAIASDPGKLRQILLNLLGNAIKFTEVGFVRLELDSTGDGGLAIRVTDSGIGMTEAERDSAFRPFWQSERSRNARVSGGRSAGTGLGLTITRRLTTLLGGSVEVASEPGAGTTFTVTLPAAPA